MNNTIRHDKDGGFTVMPLKEITFVNKTKIMKAKQLARLITKDNKEIPNKEQFLKSINKIILQLWKDFQSIVIARKIENDISLFKLIDQMNDKSNAVRAILKDHYGTHIVTVNMFSEIIRRQAPEAFEGYTIYRSEIISKRMAEDERNLTAQEEANANAVQMIIK